jgi:Bacterial Ig-like domain (group 1)
MKMNFGNAMMQLVRVLGLVVVTAALSLQGCGGNGAGGSGAGFGLDAPKTVTDPVSAKATSVVLLSSRANLPSDGKTSATITVIVKDASNRTLPNAAVDLSTTDTESVLQVADAKTGADGTLKATLISTGKSNRIIPITALVGTNKAVLDVPVAGSTLTVNGASALTFSRGGEYSLSLKDSSGLPVANAPVTLASQAGNTFTPATLKTDASGQANFTVNAVKNGSDIVTVTAAGAVGTKDILVASAQLSFTNLGNGEEVNVAATKVVNVLLVDNGVPGANKTISVSTTRGSVTPASGVVTTDGTGRASFSVASSTAGPATINITGPSGTSSSGVVEFISTSPSAIKLQPSIAVIAANPVGLSGNTSTLLANVKDAVGNPVKGVKVNFSADPDPSNGTIVPGYAITNSAGDASVAFISGPNASGPNAVKLKATVESAPSVTSASVLTVTNGGISIRLGTGNKMITFGDLRYRFLWTALVVDSAGIPVPNAEVTIQVTPDAYYKGVWQKPASRWNAVFSVSCPSEDGINNPSELDGILQPGEDKNGSGTLTPGDVAGVTFVDLTNKTDLNGFKDFYIEYAKSYGNFTRVRIEAKTRVRGTEASVSEIIDLPILDDDATAPSPPAILRGGQYVSPFGISTSCTDTN